jgi:hypothetical protein
MECGDLFQFLEWVRKGICSLVSNSVITFQFFKKIRINKWVGSREGKDDEMKWREINEKVSAALNGE